MQPVKKIVSLCLQGNSRGVAVLTCFEGVISRDMATIRDG